MRSRGSSPAGDASGAAGAACSLMFILSKDHAGQPPGDDGERDRQARKRRPGVARNRRYRLRTPLCSRPVYCVGRRRRSRPAARTPAPGRCGGTLAGNTRLVRNSSFADEVDRGGSYVQPCSCLRRTSASRKDAISLASSPPASIGSRIEEGGADLELREHGAARDLLQRPGARHGVIGRHASKREAIAVHPHAGDARLAPHDQILRGLHGTRRCRAALGDAEGHDLGADEAVVIAIR